MSEWRIERKGHVEVWTVQGEARNSITMAMLAELESNLARVGPDRQVRCVVLTGEGEKAFCAGADLKERAGMSADEVHRFHHGLRRALRGIVQAPQPFLAALNGAALGGGLELALACDLRSPPPRVLGLPEVGLGIIPGGGGTQRLARLVGVARAKDLVLTARRVDAAEALAMGLVARVVQPSRLRRSYIGTLICLFSFSEKYKLSYNSIFDMKAGSCIAGSSDLSVIVRNDIAIFLFRGAASQKADKHDQDEE